MGFIPHVFIAICIVAIKLSIANGMELNETNIISDESFPSEFSKTEKKFAKVFITDITNAKEFGTTGNMDFKEIVDGLLKAVHLLKKSKDAGADQKESLMIGFAAALADMIITECSPDLSIEHRTRIVTDALSDAYTQATGEANEAIIEEVAYLVKIFLVSDVSELGTGDQHDQRTHRVPLGQYGYHPSARGRYRYDARRIPYYQHNRGGNIHNINFPQSERRFNGRRFPQNLEHLRGLDHANGPGHLIESRNEHERHIPGTKFEEYGRHIPGAEFEEYGRNRPNSEFLLEGKQPEFFNGRNQRPRDEFLVKERRSDALRLEEEDFPLDLKRFEGGKGLSKLLEEDGGQPEKEYVQKEGVSEINLKDTYRFHNSRILKSKSTDNGLEFLGEPEYQKPEHLEGEGEPHGLPFLKGKHREHGMEFSKAKPEYRDLKYIKGEGRPQGLEFLNREPRLDHLEFVDEHEPLQYREVGSPHSFKSTKGEPRHHDLEFLEPEPLEIKYLEMERIPHQEFKHFDGEDRPQGLQFLKDKQIHENLEFLESRPHILKFLGEEPRHHNSNLGEGNPKHKGLKFLEGEPQRLDTLEGELEPEGVELVKGRPRRLEVLRDGPVSPGLDYLEGEPRKIDILDGEPELEGLKLGEGRPRRLKVLANKHIPKVAQFLEGGLPRIGILEGEPEGLELVEGRPRRVDVLRHGPIPPGLDYLEGEPRRIYFLEGKPELEGLELEEGRPRRLEVLKEEPIPIGSEFLEGGPPIKDILEGEPEGLEFVEGRPRRVEVLRDVHIPQIAEFAEGERRRIDNLEGEPELHGSEFGEGRPRKLEVLKGEPRNQELDFKESEKRELELLEREHRQRGFKRVKDRPRFHDIEFRGEPKLHDLEYLEMDERPHEKYYTQKENPPYDIPIEEEGSHLDREYDRDEGNNQPPENYELPEPDQEYYGRQYPNPNRYGYLRPEHYRHLRPEHYGYRRHPLQPRFRNGHSYQPEFEKKENYHHRPEFVERDRPSVPEYIEERERPQLTEFSDDYRTGFSPDHIRPEESSPLYHNDRPYTDILQEKSIPGYSHDHPSEHSSKEYKSTLENEERYPKKLERFPEEIGKESVDEPESSPLLSPHASRETPRSPGDGKAESSSREKLNHQPPKELGADIMTKNNNKKTLHHSDHETTSETKIISLGKTQKPQSSSPSLSRTEKLSTPLGQSTSTISETTSNIDFRKLKNEIVKSQKTKTFQETTPNSRTQHPKKEKDNQPNLEHGASKAASIFSLAHNTTQSSSSGHPKLPPIQTEPKPRTPLVFSTPSLLSGAGQGATRNSKQDLNGKTTKSHSYKVTETISNKTRPVTENPAASVTTLGHNNAPETTPRPSGPISKTHRETKPSSEGGATTPAPILNSGPKTTPAVEHGGPASSSSPKGPNSKSPLESSTSSPILGSSHQKKHKSKHGSHGETRKSQSSSPSPPTPKATNKPTHYPLGPSTTTAGPIAGKKSNIESTFTTLRPSNASETTPLPSGTISKTPKKTQSSLKVGASTLASFKFGNNYSGSSVTCFH
ncbi:hypothetical protein JTE90_011518 [Oedothorax gibbosus]|uniref:Spidroin N-terminal domain-containing protein n=1 Tax=Oedothorax gibbosus TaxID=931172 RepID=A0AAV6UHX0_9ARAC|nr:hypothetical protein JTE90_011518 [Oedothorax gibbosus]